MWWGSESKSSCVVVKAIQEQLPELMLLFLQLRIERSQALNFICTSSICHLPMTDFTQSSSNGESPPGVWNMSATTYFPGGLPRKYFRHE